jgi:hypothetical protein
MAMGKPRKAPTAETLLTGRKKSVKYTIEVAHTVLDRVAGGQGWSEICRSPGMPSLSALYSWKRRHPAFAEAHEMAKDMAADTAADEALRVARETTPATASASRVQIGALQWMAAKAAPQRYGAKPEPAQLAPAPTRLLIRMRHFEKVVGPDGRLFMREIPLEGDE